MTVHGSPDEDSPTRGDVGYDSTVRRWVDPICGTFETPRKGWEVEVTRGSDMAVLTRIFAWHWRAKRFAKSPTRLGRAFDKNEQAARERQREERVIVDMSKEPFEIRELCYAEPKNLRPLPKNEDPYA